MKFLFIVCIICVSTALAFIPEASGVEAVERQSPNDDLSDDGKIVNGLQAQSCQFPYQVGVLEYPPPVNGVPSDFIRYCGGSLIKPNLILTAGHCLFGKRASNIKVLVGTKFLSDRFNPNFMYDSASLVVHDAYNASSLANDIALIWLTDSVVLNPCSVQLIQLALAADETLPDTEQLLVSGWGQRQESPPIYGPNQLNYVPVPIVPINKCIAVYSTSNTPVSSVANICAGYSYGGQNSCFGDSGGPLIRISNGNQVGIVSFGNRCAGKDDATVYVRVYYFLSWINAQRPPFG